MDDAVVYTLGSVVPRRPVDTIVGADMGGTSNGLPLSGEDADERVDIRGTDDAMTGKTS